ncbi:monovalent cation/H+ antiporter complex subunit F [Paractinoplanes brasiliensis]|uniref:Multicomponent Na+:H+ antiporter subunit F n=1 Tax=Paractinoplanes brasiliensis TaxID=52695 RepID=A0A4R6JAF0_9ACTN|nr:monovalent cation/H+ antiporter complex subunit F [Actinoplanes brasiliensis]TDO32663.1 multicomponent Na+:H+ antiporter subunit F [Actinoplanes brasiliensis]GID32796.1 hypothetical protein Abr02nite_77790 [Actinoplanes brasiliensis]
MTVVAVLVTTLLAVGAGLALIRVVRGPSVLDRIVATDVLLALIVMALAMEAAFSRDATVLPVLAVLSILGFTGAVSVARFAIRRTEGSASEGSASEGSASEGSAFEGSASEGSAFEGSAPGGFR